MSNLAAHLTNVGYGKKVVLPAVSCGFVEGEITAIIGPNGAGKSTLLKAIVGLNVTGERHIECYGVDVSSRGPAENARRGLCMVPQGNRVFAELNVKANLFAASGVGNAVTRRLRLERVLHWFPALQDRLNVTAGHLSGGEKQQLALGRALMMEPRTLLLDEPSLGLDPRHVGKAFGILRSINKEKRLTLLIVEQNVREVLKIADQVLALRNGTVVFQGEPSEVLEGDTLKKIFLG